MDKPLSETHPSLFYLERAEDVSGVSGTGIVADGVVFPDGKAILNWRTSGGSTAIYPSIEALEKIHGHEGRTKVVFLEIIDKAIVERDYVKKSDLNEIVVDAKVGTFAIENMQFISKDKAREEIILNMKIARNMAIEAHKVKVREAIDGAIIDVYARGSKDDTDWFARNIKKRLGL